MFEDPQLREIVREFGRLAGLIDQNARLLNEVISRVGKLEQLAAAIAPTGVGDSAAPNQAAAAKEMIGTSVERLQKYLTAIIFGGYAAFFGFWTFLHGKTNSIVDAASGLMMLISIVVFFGRHR